MFDSCKNTENLVSIFGWIKCISTQFIQPKILTRFYVFLQLSNVLGSQYTHSTNDLVCCRPEDDLMLG